MRREKMRVFGHSVEKFDAPDVVLLLLVLLHRRRNVDDLLSPLPHGKTWAISTNSHR
jgi:hypothetical protein